MFLLTNGRESISGESGRALHTRWNLPSNECAANVAALHFAHFVLLTCSLSREFIARSRKSSNESNRNFRLIVRLHLSPSRARVLNRDETGALPAPHCVPVKRSSRKTDFRDRAYRGPISSKSRESPRSGLFLGRCLRSRSGRACDSRFALTNRLLHTPILLPLLKPHLSHVWRNTYRPRHEHLPAAEIPTGPWTLT